MNALFGHSMQQSAAAWLPGLLDAAVKGAALLVVAAVAAGLLRRRSAAARQVVWLLALAAMLVLPALSHALPGWQLLPAWTRLDVPAQPQEEPALAESPAPAPMATPPAAEPLPMADISPSLPPLPAEHAPPVALVEPGPVEPPVASAAPAVAAPPPAKPFDWTTLLPWALLVWAAGTAACLAPLVLGRVGLWRLARRSRPLDGPAWGLLLRRASAALGLRRRVVLLHSRDEPMPMVWGIWRPRLLLPAEAADWSPERRWVVLLHELAHAKRHDCLAKLVAHLACAAYWFNPLAWWAYKRMQAEAETACDDLVLSAGHKPSDYATHLLEIASGLKSGMLAAYSSIAMARRSKLEGRLLAILDAGRNRQSLTRWGVLVAACLVAGVVVPLACVRVTQKDEPVGFKPSEEVATTQPHATQATALPGSGITDLLPYFWNEAIGAVMEAVEEPQSEALGDGAMVVAAQDFKIVEFLGRHEINSPVQIAYRYDSRTESPVQKGQRVIWVVGHAVNSVQWGLKAYADTPVNRQAVAETVAAFKNNSTYRRPNEPLPLLLPGSRVSPAQAMGKGRPTIALCQAVDTGWGNMLELGVVHFQQPFKVIQTLSGPPVEGEVTVNYTQFDLDVGRERKIEKGEQVIWIMQPLTHPGADHRTGVKALLDSPANRRLLDVGRPGLSTQPASQPAGAKLALCSLPVPQAVAGRGNLGIGEDTLNRAMTSLQQDGGGAVAGGGDLRWVKVNAPLPDGAITATHESAQYVLVRYGWPYALVPTSDVERMSSPQFGIVRAEVWANPSGRASLELHLCGQSQEGLRSMVRMVAGSTMAVVIDDVVVATRPVEADMDKQPIVLADLAEDEARRLAVAFLVGMPAGSEIRSAIQAGDLDTVKQLIQDNPYLISALSGPGTQDQSLVHQAAGLKRTEILELLLANGADVNARARYGLTPLHSAARQGDTEIVKFLLAHGADPSAVDDMGLTPLHSALGHKAVVEALLDGGADINATGDPGMTPLSMCLTGILMGEITGHSDELHKAFEEMADLLRSRGAKVDLVAAAAMGDEATVARLVAEDPAALKGRQPRISPVNAAVLAGNEKIVTLLLDNGASLDAGREQFAPPLGTAALAGKENIVRLLLARGADPLVPGADGEPAIHGAAYYGHIRIAELLLPGSGVDCRTGGATGPTPLYFAAMGARPEMARFLLDRGAAVDAPGYQESTPLMAAVTAGSQLGRSKRPEFLDQAREVAALLLEKGADVNARASGKTPLWLALDVRPAAGPIDLQMVKLLLDKGADVSAAGGRQGTPLHLAAEKGDLEAVKLLIVAGADPTAVNGPPPFGGKTALDVAREKDKSSPVAVYLLSVMGERTPATTPASETPAATQPAAEPMPADGAGMPPASLPEPATQRAGAIRPGDTLEIRVLELVAEGVETTMARTVSQSGTIQLLKFKEPIRVQGLSLDEARAAIVQAYAHAGILKNPSVTVKFASATQPGPETMPADGAGMPPASRPGDDESAVRQATGQFLAALWDSNWQRMKEVSAGTVEGWLVEEPKGWKFYVALGRHEESLRRVMGQATEIRQLYGSKQEFLAAAHEAAIDADLALVRVGIPGEQGREGDQVFILRKISDRWWFAGSGAGPLAKDASLATTLHEYAEQLRALLAELKPADSQPATQPTPETMPADGSGMPPAEVSDEQLLESVRHVRAEHAAGGESMWRALAELVRPGMTVRQLYLALPPRETVVDEPGTLRFPRLTLWNGNSFLHEYALDDSFGVEASGFGQIEENTAGPAAATQPIMLGNDAMVLSDKPRIKPLPAIGFLPSSNPAALPRAETMPADGAGMPPATQPVSLATDDYPRAMARLSQAVPHGQPTPLHKLLGNFHPGWKATAQDMDDVRRLIQEAKDIDARDTQGRTALHLASAYAQPEIVKLLLAKGADVNAMADKSWTPLHYAADATNGVQEVRKRVPSVVELLLKAGADPFMDIRPGELASMRPIEMVNPKGGRSLAGIVRELQGGTTTPAEIVEVIRLLWTAMEPGRNAAIAQARPVTQAFLRSVAAGDADGVAKATWDQDIERTGQQKKDWKWVSDVIRKRYAGKIERLTTIQEEQIDRGMAAFKVAPPEGDDRWLLVVVARFSDGVWRVVMAEEKQNDVSLIQPLEYLVGTRGVRTLLGEDQPAPSPVNDK